MSAAAAKNVPRSVSVGHAGTLAERLQPLILLLF